MNTQSLFFFGNRENNNRNNPPDDEEAATDRKVGREPSASTLSTASSSNSRLVDAVISSKLKDISLEDRSSGLHDLHGVLALEQETPELLKQQVAEMTRELIASREPNKQAYQMAMAKSPHYIQNLKIAFLRAESHQPKQAATRMIRFFHCKLQHFGPELLVQEIHQQDHLSEIEKDALRKGILQLLPQRDRAGRAVLFIHGQVNIQYSNETALKLLFYMVMVALQDVETQKHGIVGIYYGIGQDQVAPGRPLQFWKSWRALPWRMVAFHLCFNTSVINLSAHELCSAMESRNVCRFRLHNGTNLECVYALLTFGIPKDALPVTVDGTIELQSHHQMLDAIARREEQTQQAQLEKSPNEANSSNNKDDDNTKTVTDDENDNTNNILVPSPMDIIMGRGRQPKGRPGNLRFYNLLEEFQEDFETASKMGKYEIVTKILTQLKQGGSRFLKSTPTGHVESDPAAAREKIVHGFRTVRIKHNQQEQQQQGKSNASRKKQQQQQRNEGQVEEGVFISKKRHL